MFNPLPKSVVFVCDDASALSAMCAALYMAFNSGRSVAFSAGSVERAALNPMATKVCSNHGVEIKNHRRLMWRDILAAGEIPEFVIALTPAAQHLVLEVTRNHHIDVEYWPLYDPRSMGEDTEELTEIRYEYLIDQIRTLLINRFGIGQSWSDAAPLPIYEAISSDNSGIEFLSHDEKVKLTKENLELRPVEISAYLYALRLLLEEKTRQLEGRKPNDAEALKEWQSWMDFLFNAHQSVVKLSLLVNEAASSRQVAPAIAEQTQNVLDTYKKAFFDWPRENAAEVVDGTFRATLVGCCAVVGGLFGQPIAGALIGAAIFGGSKVGKAIGDAIKSGSPTT